MIRTSKKVLACVCSLALLIGLMSVLPLLSTTADVSIPAPGYGQSKNLITAGSAWVANGFTYADGVLTAGADPNDAVGYFSNTGLAATDTYVYRSKIHQTSCSQPYGPRVVFRYTDPSNYLLVEFRTAGALLMKMENGVYDVATANYHYTGYELGAGAEEIAVDIISAPQSVTVLINGQVAFDNIAVPQMGAQVGYVRMYSTCTVDNLVLYNTAKAIDGIPAPGMGRNDLITPYTALACATWHPFSFQNGVLNSGTDGSGSVVRFNTPGLAATDTYVFSASYHQTSAGYLVPGTRVVFRYTDDNNYMSVEFREGATLLIGMIGGNESHLATYTGFKATKGAHDVKIDIISAPDKVTVLIDDVLAFNNVAIPKGGDNNTLGAQVGFRKEVVLFTADNLTLYATNDAVIPANAEIPKLPYAGANLVKADTPITHHWGGPEYFTYANGVLSSSTTNTDVNTFKFLLGDDETYVMSLDLAYDMIALGDENMLWYRPEIILRTSDTNGDAVILSLMGDKMYLTHGTEGKVAGSYDFSRGDVGKVHLDIISGPTSATVFLNGVKAIDVAGLPDTYIRSWMGVRAINTAMTVTNLQVFRLPRTVTATAGEGGTISPAGSQTVATGDSIEYTVNHKMGYVLKNVTVDGQPVAVADDGTFTLEGVSADHQVVATFEKILKMQDGAAVRLQTPTGLRFSTEVSQAALAQLDALQEAGIIKGYTLGTLILPKNLLGDGELTLETADVLNVERTMWQEGAESEGYNRMTAVLWNIKEKNYTREYAARAYLTIIAPDGTAETIYSDFSAENVRTVANVAAAALADPNTEYTAAEKTVLEGYAAANN